MNIWFDAKGILERGKGLTFDEVLLVPQHSEISSRRHPELNSKLTRTIDCELPIIAANMDTITESDMAFAMAEMGGMGIIHRFMDPRSQFEEVKKLRTKFEAAGLKKPVAASIGVKENGKERANLLADAGVECLTIDIAHGDSVQMWETLEYVKSTFPHIQVIAGNVATPGGVKGLIDRGADAIKVGIGPGSMCTTRIITGCGVPQLTAIRLCVEEAKKHDVPVIADGGIRSSGDIMKCFAAGASSVMLGSMFSGCLETPGEIVKGQKKYRGMASKDAQVSWRGDLPEGMAPEGESTLIPCKGSVKNVLHEIAGGIRSGMTYLNASNLQEIETNARFMEMGFSGVLESRPHGVR